LTQPNNDANCDRLPELDITVRQKPMTAH